MHTGGAVGWKRPERPFCPPRRQGEGGKAPLKAPFLLPFVIGKGFQLDTLQAT